ncbi:MAG: hypothetical protein R3F60_04715 [bacterium]
MAPDAGMAPDVSLPPDASVPPAGDGCGRDPGANDRTWTLTHQGRERRFRVHVPAGYDRTRPTDVVLDFHGRGVSPELHLLQNGMLAAADRRGFIAVHPTGDASDLTWNAGVCCGAAMTSGADDVGFVAAMVDELAAALCVDRVFATGLSNGGFFAHRLACDRADLVEGIAPVAGTLGVLCQPSRPVPVLHFHGTGDQVVPYEGFFGFVSVAETMAAWARANGCRDARDAVFTQGDVRCEAWQGCAAPVVLCTVEGGGHTWPGGRAADAVTARLAGRAGRGRHRPGRTGPPRRRCPRAPPDRPPRRCGRRSRRRARCSTPGSGRWRGPGRRTRSHRRRDRGR